LIPSGLFICQTLILSTIRKRWNQLHNLKFFYELPAIITEASVKNVIHNYSDKSRRTGRQNFIRHIYPPQRVLVRFGKISEGITVSGEAIKIGWLLNEALAAAH
jgi:hypothetical protein